MEKYECALAEEVPLRLGCVGPGRAGTEIFRSREGRDWSVGSAPQLWLAWLRPWGSGEERGGNRLERVGRGQALQSFSGVCQGQLEKFLFYSVFACRREVSWTDCLSIQRRSLSFGREMWRGWSRWEQSPSREGRRWPCPGGVRCGDLNGVTVNSVKNRDNNKRLILSDGSPSPLHSTCLILRTILLSIITTTLQMRK